MKHSLRLPMIERLEAPSIPTSASFLVLSSRPSAMSSIALFSFCSVFCRPVGIIRYKEGFRGPSRKSTSARPTVGTLPRESNTCSTILRAPRRAPKSCPNPAIPMIYKASYSWFEMRLSETCTGLHTGSVRSRQCFTVTSS